MRKHGDQMGGGSEKTSPPDGMGESEEACLTITTKRYKSLITTISLNEKTVE